MKAFENALVYVYGEGLKKTSIVFDQRIRSFGSAEGAEKIQLPPCARVVPGFIDRHVHGAGGCDAMDASRAALGTIADELAREGTVGFLATTMTQSEQNITRALGAVKDYVQSGAKSGARLIGVHLEGPFISASYKGAQPGEYIVKPSAELFDSFNKASGNNIKAVTLAPEEEGADELIAHLKKIGADASIGHTAAKYADVERAVKLGAGSVTHTYNGMTGIHHRDAGAAGGALLFDELNCELICDGIHVSVPAMKLLCKCKPASKISLITDSIRAKRVAGGVSELGGQTVYVNGNEARLKDGTLAGSVLKMNEAVKNLNELVGVPFERAVDCASINPALSLGIEKDCGSIEIGKRADFAVLGDGCEVLLTVRGGEIVYKRA